MNGTLKFWNTTTSSLERIFQFLPVGFICLEFSPKGRFIVFLFILDRDKIDLLLNILFKPVNAKTFNIKPCMDVPWIGMTYLDANDVGPHSILTWVQPLFIPVLY